MRLLDEQRLLQLVLLPTSHARNDYVIISMSKSIDLQANAVVPPGATVRLTVEYRSKTKQISLLSFFSIKIRLIEFWILYICNVKSQLSYETTA